MSKNPLLLLIRFLMELAALAIVAMWGWHCSTDWTKYLLAIGLPLIAATIWGVFRIPNDPNPAPVEVPGIVRLSYELFLFGFSTWALYDMGYITYSYVMGIVIIVSYVGSYDRTLKMLLNKR
jgi:hypothetical protein